MNKPKAGCTSPYNTFSPAYVMLHPNMLRELGDVLTNRGIIRNVMKHVVMLKYRNKTHYSEVRVGLI